MSTPITPVPGPDLAAPFAYLETTGRTTGKPHEIEIWFAGETGDDGDAGRLYLMAGGRDRADWVKNVRRTPHVRIRIAGRWYGGTARVIEGEAGEVRARSLVCAKYMRYDPARDSELPSGWCSEALPVAIMLDPTAAE